MSELQIAGLKVHLNLSALTPSGMTGGIVLLHGFGAPGTDLVSIGDALTVPPGTGIFFPEGPLDLGQLLGPAYHSARAWWPIDMALLQVAMMTGQVERAAQALSNGLAQAADQVARLLDGIQSEFGLDPSRVVLGGFSQGAVACLEVVLSCPHRFAGLILLSGTMVSPDAIDTLAPKLAGMRALLSHGQLDPILPFSVAECLRDRLLRAGWDISWVPFRGGHGIPSEVIRVASTLVLQTLK